MTETLRCRGCGQVFPDHAAHTCPGPFGKVETPFTKNLKDVVDELSRQNQVFRQWFIDQGLIRTLNNLENQDESSDRI